MEFTEKDLLLILPAMASHIVRTTEIELDDDYSKILKVYGEDFFDDMQKMEKSIQELYKENFDLKLDEDGYSNTDVKFILLFKTIMKNFLDKDLGGEYYED